VGGEHTPVRFDAKIDWDMGGGGLWFWLTLRACQRFRRQVREVENGLIRELSRALREELHWP